MDRFARRDTIDSINLFYDVILCDRKIKNESEKEDFEASYFAMCLLLPKEPFLDTVNYLGGIDECYKNNNIKDVTLKLYPGDRHEILNELDKETVYHDLLEWMLERMEKK